MRGLFLKSAALAALLTVFGTCAMAQSSGGVPRTSGAMHQLKTFLIDNSTRRLTNLSPERILLLLKDSEHRTTLNDMIGGKKGAKLLEAFGIKSQGKLADVLGGIPSPLSDRLRKAALDMLDDYIGSLDPNTPADAMLLQQLDKWKATLASGEDASTALKNFVNGIPSVWYGKLTDELDGDDILAAIDSLTVDDVTKFLAVFDSSAFRSILNDMSLDELTEFNKSLAALENAVGVYAQLATNTGPSVIDLSDMYAADYITLVTPSGGPRTVGGFLDYYTVGGNFDRFAFTTALYKAVRDNSVNNWMKENGIPGGYTYGANDFSGEISGELGGASMLVGSYSFNVNLQESNITGGQFSASYASQNYIGVDGTGQFNQSDKSFGVGGFLAGEGSDPFGASTNMKGALPGTDDVFGLKTGELNIYDSGNGFPTTYEMYNGAMTTTPIP